MLSKRGLTAKRLREEIDKLVKKRLEETWGFGRLPGTPHFKNVVAVAIEQCQNLGSSLVCTEHLLLGLLKEKGSVAHKTLNALGVSFDDARNDIQELMASA